MMRPEGYRKCIRLMKLADKFNIPVIGLTGSNGKTTSKELINSVLSQKFNVTSTLNNFNNHIGVPLTILEIKDVFFY